MDIIETIFQRKAVNQEKLTDYGFSSEGGAFSYRTVLPGSGFEMTVTISSEGKVAACVTDPAFQCPYTLHLAPEACGKFVTGVRTEYEAVLLDIADGCFEADVFKTRQARELISYVRNAYGDELEFLWDRFPDNAIWRRADNQKWYGALLTVSGRKLGMDSDEAIEIIDLRIQPDKMEALLDNRRYFPGWHMNKKSWYTVVLDSSVPSEELQARVDESYSLAADFKKGMR